MDFIKHFSKLLSEKTKSFEDTKGHYNEGIKTIE